jgi:hypothetical protein
MKTKIIYRIENLTDKNGMWYDKDGEPKKNKFIYFALMVSLKIYQCQRI